VSDPGALVVGGIGELVTNASDVPGDLAVLHDAAVAIEAGTVVWVGDETRLPGPYRGLPVLDVAGRAVVPGFVDAHTHVVFAGDRADEFARRLGGERYEDRLAAGGGILSTVAATRAAGEDELVAQAADRVERMLRAGTTTIEIKSGYGLDVETERRMLRVAHRLGHELPVDVVATFLGAHVVPAEYRDRRDAYVDLVCGPMMDACAPLAEFCDVFCDEAAFDVDESRRILEAGIAHGLRPRVHADQLSRVGAARLAAEVGAVAADHLDHVSDEDLAALAEAGTVAVFLPGVSLSMRAPYPDARRAWDAGVTVAIATDCNPGTAWMERMSFMVALAAIEMGLTPSQSLWAATRGGALALARPDRGRLMPGDRGDLVVLDAPSHLHIPYRPDTDLVGAVVAAGRVVGR